MILVLGTKPNINGQVFQCLIDTEKKTYETGYYLSMFVDIHTTKKDINSLIQYTLISEGYKPVS